MCQIKCHLIFFIVGMLLVLSPKLLADCGWEGPFLENIEQSDLIVRGKVIDSNENTPTPSPSLEIEVLEIYRGTSDNSKLRITYYPFRGTFLIGTEWILALNQWPSGSYTISDCWGSYLKVAPLVVGNLNNATENDAEQRISLNEFNNLLKGETSSLLLTDYEEGVQAGLRKYKALHGLGSTRYGRLYIPAVDVLEASGNTITYEVILNQIESSFVFELDLDSVKTHQ